mgnify:CR=1 FL=1
MGEIGNPAAVSGGIDLSQFYGVFFEEAGENLASMEGLLLALDVEEPVEDDLHAIFRAAHSIKGGAATFGFADVAELTHDLETLLDKLRRHELKPSAAMVDALLEAGDLLKAQLAKHRGDEVSKNTATTELRARIRTFASGEAPEAAAPKGRLVDIRVGPLPDPAFADNLFELFRDVPDMGTIEKTDEGQADAEGCRHFRVRTPCGDEELRDLFSFHVDREHVHIRPVEAAAPAAPAASAPAAPAKSAVQEDDGFGFFMDPHEAREAAAQADEQAGVLPRPPRRRCPRPWPRPSPWPRPKRPPTSPRRAARSIRRRCAWPSRRWTS